MPVFLHRCNERACNAQDGFGRVKILILPDDNPEQAANHAWYEHMHCLSIDLLVEVKKGISKDRPRLTPSDSIPSDPVLIGKVAVDHVAYLWWEVQKSERLSRRPFKKTHEVCKEVQESERWSRRPFKKMHEVCRETRKKSMVRDEHFPRNPNDHMQEHKVQQLEEYGSERLHLAGCFQQYVSEMNVD